MSGFLLHVELKNPDEIDFGHYPFNLPAVRRLGRLRLNPKITFLVGENDSGKSTLIEAIALKAGFNAEGGTKNFSGRQRPSESALNEHLLMARGARREKGGFFLRAETMFNVSTEAEAYREYGWELLHERSHGEAFLWVINNRFRDQGLFILDEPEAALSPTRQLACLRRMHQLASAGSQFVIATHSPILMACPGAWIYELCDTGLRRVTLEDTEHYQITRTFLQNPTGVLEELLSKD